MLDTIEITINDKTPKYIQLANAMEMYISNGNVSLNEKIPSVKKFSEKLNLSRETVFKSFNILAEKGIIVSSNRRGYFIAKTDVDINYRVFFMMDKMTSFKEKIYDGLRERLGKKGEVDVYFHHGNLKVFEALIDQNLSSYSHFVIITFLSEGVGKILNKIPEGRLILLDKGESSIKIPHSQIYQDFQSDIFDSLSKVSKSIEKYHEIFLVAPADSPHREPIIKGFLEFCNSFDFKNFTVIDDNNIGQIHRGVLYILIGIKEDDLVKIIKYCRNNKIKLGEDIGVISYNDTQMKEILEGGITVISTDFLKMGQRAAEIIQNNETVMEKNPSDIIVRKSL